MGSFEYDATNQTSSTTHAQLSLCVSILRTYTHLHTLLRTLLVQPTARCILFDGENISFHASVVIYIYIYSPDIRPIMIINRIYETQNVLSL